MPTVDAAAASAREPMDWEAMHREQQRHITASMAEDFKRRDEIRRQHVEDALAAMQSQALDAHGRRGRRTARTYASQQTVGRDDEEPPTPDLVWRVVDADDPIVSGLAHIYSAALQSSGFASEKDERESLARQRAAPGHAER
jgi:hypothetical protein